MESNKYYTPDIEEFYVGFEYESLQDERYPEKDSSWGKQSIDDEWEMRAFIGYYCGDHLAGLRVKYLDKEDIESLGFERQVAHSVYFKKDGYRLVHWVTKTKINREVDIYKVFDKDDEQLIFRGIVKNKSELKKLLDQLGVI